MHHQQIKNIISILTELIAYEIHYIPIIDLNLPIAINIIKSKIKSYFWQHFITNLDPDNVHKLHYLSPCGSCILHHSTSNYHQLWHLTLPNSRLYIIK